MMIRDLEHAREVAAELREWRALEPDSITDRDGAPVAFRRAGFAVVDRRVAAADFSQNRAPRTPADLSISLPGADRADSSEIVTDRDRSRR